MTIKKKVHMINLFVGNVPSACKVYIRKASAEIDVADQTCCFNHNASLQHAKCISGKRLLR